MEESAQHNTFSVPFYIVVHSEIFFYEAFPTHNIAVLHMKQWPRREKIGSMLHAERVNQFCTLYLVLYSCCCSGKKSVLLVWVEYRMILSFKEW